jgi:heterogeneous nuclear ribonucleoprotein L
MDYDNDHGDYGGQPPQKKWRGGGGGGENGGMEHFLQRNDDKIPPNHILLFSVTNTKYPVNVEVMYKVTSIIGKVKKIVCFERNNIVQAMVEFDTLESASKARSSLHGCDIYNDSCTMKVEYSKLEALSVRENGPTSWDFTEGSEPGQAKRKSILNLPDPAGGGNSGSPFGGSGTPFSGSGASFSGSGPPFGGNTGAPFSGMPMSGATTKIPSLVGMGMGGMQPVGGHMGVGRMAGGGGGMGGFNTGYGGGGNDMGYHGAMGHHGVGGGEENKSCVLLIYGLEPPKWNCDRVFNLLCQYGNVNQIFFMKNKPNTAWVEMGSPEGVDNVMKNLRDIEIFGEKVRFDVSKKHMRIASVPSPFDMSDGSSSNKEYYSERDLNRFISPDQARKNRIIRPSKVLHFFGISKLSDEEMKDIFASAGAAVPNQVKWVPAKEGAKLTGVGLVYFDTLTEATEALVLANHVQVEGKYLKLCFSPAKY